MPGEAENGFAFLYKTERGVVDAHTWRRAAWPLVSLFVAATVGWLAARPFVSRTRDPRAFFDAAALAANIYALLYALGLILLGICWVNLTAKRFRDLGRAPPVGLAGLVPLLALLDGAVRWLQPRLEGTMPHWIVYGGDVLVAAALIWTIVECSGVRSSRHAR